jgi:uncharacterized protein (TIGR03437 family)
MGDILLECTGGVPFGGVNGNLSIFLSVPMTNRVNGNGVTDVNLTIDQGFGPMPTNAQARYLNSSTISFSGIAFNLSSTGGVNLRLSNLRGAANQAGVDTGRQITALLSFNGGELISFSNNVFPIGTTARSLFSSSTSSLICAQYGSPSLSTLTMSNALAVQASYSTVRVTEGFPSSLAPKSDISFQNADFGSRIVVRFTGVPQGVHLYVPDGVVGYDGLQPTSAGDYGLTPAGGTYAPGNGTLLLLRIPSADVNGGGLGSGPAIPVPTETTVFDSLEEVTVAPDGSAEATYEVFDSNDATVQSATIPSFLYVPPNLVQSFTTINEDVVLGVSSTSLDTSSAATIPRFVPVAAPNDCSTFGDCGASYFPVLAVDTKSITFNLTTLDAAQSQHIVISNTGGGNYLWNAQITYLNGPAAGYPWLQLSETSGINRGGVDVRVVPGTLPPGTYDAVIYIDGGPIAGTAQIPVTFNYVYQQPTPIVINAVNTANLVPGFLVPGSQAAILGSRLSGTNISVTFNGTPATVLSSVSDSRLDVQVPYTMASQQYALVVVTIDGSSSTPGLLIPIGVSNPAIFAGSILNQDNSNNTPQNGALSGTMIQVFATGLPVSGYYSGKIHNLVIQGDNLVYAGPAPNIIGVQLVQMIVPPLPSMTTSTAVCGGPTQANQTCSPAVNVTVITVPISQ